MTYRKKLPIVYEAFIDVLRVDKYYYIDLIDIGLKYASREVYDTLKRTLKVHVNKDYLNNYILDLSNDVELTDEVINEIYK